MSITHAELNRLGYDARPTIDGDGAIVRRRDNTYVLGSIKDGAVSLLIGNSEHTTSDVASIGPIFDHLLTHAEESGMSTDFSGVNPIHGSSYDHRGLRDFLGGFDNENDGDAIFHEEAVHHQFSDFLDEVIQSCITETAENIAENYGVPVDIAALWLANHYRETAYDIVRDRAAESLNAGRTKADISRIIDKRGRDDAMTR